MNDKELREIRRRFRPDKNNILSIKGCVVNGEGTIIARLNQSMVNCSVEESEKLLSVMKKSLSGGLGSNLLDLEFTAQHGLDGDKHQLLMALRNSALKDENALEAFFERVISSVHFEGNYAILLAFDQYDVFSYTSDGQKDDSSSVFPYMVCAVCPVKPLNAGLYFRDYDSTFRAIDQNMVLAPPEIGFMFPTFDDRASNIYNVLYYTRDLGNVYSEVIDTLFGVELPQSSHDQKNNFDRCLSECLEYACDYETVRSVHGQIAERMEEHKSLKKDEPLKLTKNDLSFMLESCGVDGERVGRFGKRFDEEFGKNAEVTPKNIMDVKKFDLETPDVSIKVNPERTDLVTTQVINGVKYILIRAAEGVEVNGVNITIQ